jgi:Cd2+/Zn2+-exporting ATPase
MSDSLSTDKLAKEDDVPIKDTHDECSEGCGCGCGCCHGHGEGEENWVTFWIGVVLFIASFFVGHESPWGIGCLILAYFLIGGEILMDAVKNLFSGHIFDENFLMMIASVGALLLGEYAEAVAVMLFFRVGEYYQEKAVKKSRRSVIDLMDLNPEQVHLLKDGQVVDSDPTDVPPDAEIVVRPGEKIPLDGVVLSGESRVDTSALTGEFLPLAAKPGTELLSGCINQDGALTIRVTKEWKDSTVARILQLVQEASSRKAKTETFIRRFARYYTPFVLILAVLIAVITPFALDITWQEGLKRALILLVISCPCALVVSIPLSYFAGIGRCARFGILLKGSNFLDALTRIGTVVFDKTGTLTAGHFTVTDILPCASGTMSQEELLGLVALAEGHSNHPIASSIQTAWGKEIDLNRIDQYEEISGHGTKVRLTDGTEILAGNERLLSRNGIGIPETGSGIGTKVFVAVNGTYAGQITLNDVIKNDSQQAIKELKALGVAHIAMLTGDHPQHAQAVSDHLGLDAFHAGLLPEDKVRIIQEFESKRFQNSLVAFVGDGINDAPALTQADLGVSMGAFGSDAAMEASDVVLMSGEPSRLPLGIKLALFTRRLIHQNIVFTIAIKVLVLALATVGLANMWGAVFADVGVCLIAILNAVRPGPFKNSASTLQTEKK